MSRGRGRASRRRRPGGCGHACARSASPTRASCISARWPQRRMSAFWELVRRDLLRRLEGRRHARRGARLLPDGRDAAAARRSAPISTCFAASRPACCGLRCCSRRCCRSGALFESDFEDGSLDILATGPLPLEAVAAAKSLAHWLTTGVPLTVLAPVLGLLLNLQPEAYGVLVATMLAGTPGRQLHRRHRRGADAARTPRRPAAGAADAAAVRADADLRHRGDAARRYGPGRLRCLRSSSFCAISLAAMVLAPLAAAAALRFQLQ